jgi:hypothetical protein
MRSLMRLARLGRACCAVWLGLLACDLHAVLPLLIAADLLHIAAPQDSNRLCSASVSHAALAKNRVPAPPERPRHGNAGSSCPLCLALSANAAFTGPSLAVLLPLPAAGRLSASRRRGGTVHATASARAYRSRAPPLG